MFPPLYGRPIGIRHDPRGVKWVFIPSGVVPREDSAFRLYERKAYLFLYSLHAGKKTEAGERLVDMATRHHATAVRREEDSHDLESGI